VEKAMERRGGYWIYVLAGTLALIVAGTLVFFTRAGPRYLGPDQLETAIESQPQECRPVLREALRRRMTETREPLRPSDVRGAMRAINSARCALQAEQLRVLAVRDVPPAE
jgi:hypothetical protein